MKPSGVSIGTVLGYLAGIAVGTMSMTLLFLGMRAVMDVGGACADGGPFVTAQPCPSGPARDDRRDLRALRRRGPDRRWVADQPRRGRRGASAGRACSSPSAGTSSSTGCIRRAAKAAPTGLADPRGLFWVMGRPVVVAIAAWRDARAGRPGDRMSRGRHRHLPAAVRPPTSRSASRPIHARRSDQSGFASSAFAPVYSSAGRSSGFGPPGDEPARDSAADLAAGLERLSASARVGRADGRRVRRGQGRVIAERRRADERDDAALPAGPRR